MPKISIIVTIYNTPVQDMQRCFDSISGQSYPDFEVIAVDDGSAPRMGQAIDQLARRDARFQVHHIENGGVSRARNTGLDLAKGEYITFCDSDDTFSEDFLKSALQLSLENDLDFITGG